MINSNYTVVRLKRENTKTKRAHTQNALLSFTDNCHLIYWSVGLAAHTSWELSFSHQTYIIVQASRFSTLTLCLFESPLNNLDLQSSGTTYKSQSYDVIRVRGQGCDAYTARLPAVFWQNPDFILLDLLVQIQDWRETSWIQKHRMDHFLLNLSRLVAVNQTNKQGLLAWRLILRLKSFKNCGGKTWCEMPILKKMIVSSGCSHTRDFPTK